MAREPESPLPSLPFTPPPLPVAELDDVQRLACLRLIRSENVGPATFRALINHYGGATTALAALPELARRGGRTRPIRICPADVAERELDAARDIGAVPLFNIEPHFPAPLAFVDGGPPLIYARGRLELLNKASVAFVGSRAASAAGLKIARQLAAGVGQAGYVVVSGLARGIDTAAHQATLDSGTIAVLAGGIDHIFPLENVALHAAIAEAGCLVSEQPPGFQARGNDFPRRNRIISGMSLAVVVEAARKSGSLITARRAADQGRDVFAVPGHPLDPRAEGTNQLLQNGAVLVTQAADIVDNLRHQQRAHFEDRAVESFVEQPDAAIPDDPAHDQDRIIAVLGPAPCDLDDIVRATALPVQRVRAALLELIIADRIEQHGAQLVSLRT